MNTFDLQFLAFEKENFFSWIIFKYVSKSISILTYIGFSNVLPFYFRKLRKKLWWKFTLWNLHFFDIFLSEFAHEWQLKRNTVNTDWKPRKVIFIFRSVLTTPPSNLGPKASDITSFFFTTHGIMILKHNVMMGRKTSETWKEWRFNFLRCATFWIC